MSQRNTLYIVDADLPSSILKAETSPGGAGARQRHRSADPYNQASGQIFFDFDGAGSSAALLFATLLPNTVLTAGMITVA